MSLIAVPNVSVGTTEEAARLASAITGAGADVLDIHVDGDHGRTVITVTASDEVLVRAMTTLVSAATEHDLARHAGQHPRFGIVDIVPFVPLRGDSSGEMDDAVNAARAAAIAIGGQGVPVYLYGVAARRPERVDLPVLRRALRALGDNTVGAAEPDEGPSEIDRRGVTCVGARGPLIAFNVWTDASLELAQHVAGEVRSPRIRALGMELPSRDQRQVSMNLTDPAALGIDAAFEMVSSRLARAGADVTATELVGLVLERFLPNPDAQAARLLIEPGRSIESVLRR